VEDLTLTTVDLPSLSQLGSQNGLGLLYACYSVSNLATIDDGLPDLDGHYYHGPLNTSLCTSAFDLPIRSICSFLPSYC
jgi:hypothetical protein